MSAIPFEQIQSASLAQADRLLRDWFPAGKRVGKEFLVGNIHGDAGESLKVNLKTGKWADFAGSDSGHDLIDLRAAMRHRGDRVAAATEIAMMLGIVVNGKDSHPKQRAQKKNGNAAEDWQPMVPPPADTPKPPDSMFSGFDTTYDYTDLNDQVTHYVGRIEARGDKAKQFIPITYGRLNGKLGWHRKAPNAPLPLYGLNRLASMPDATVILCEGEKAADAAQAMFLDYACLSWSGGTGKIGDAHLAPLKQHNVIDWPDNDDAGYKAAQKVAAALPGTRILRVDDLPYKGDAADVTIEDPDAWLAARLQPAQPNFDAEWWLTRKLDKPKPLLGEAITDTTRLLLGGPTGIGKTHLGFGMAGGIVTGIGFCHWRGPDGGVPVLYIDGEMARDLVQERLTDLKRRIHGADLSKLIVISREDFPEMEPLNTDAGRAFVLGLIEKYGIGAVFLDNRMSLTSGDMKDEQSWTETMPLVRELTRRHVALILVDHTGHENTKVYGTKTKEWQFNSVVLLQDAKRPGADLAFKLEFTKARRRRPANRQEFESVIFSIVEDTWTAEPAERPNSAGFKLGNVSPTRRPFYDALVAAIGKSAVGSGETTNEAWELECVRRGLIERPPPSDAKESWQRRGARFRDFRKAKSDLLKAGWIAVDDDQVFDLKGRWA